MKYKKPFNDPSNHDGGTIGWWFPYAVARLTYRAGDVALTLKVCDRWERYARQEGGETSYHWIRASCYVALGEFDKARLHQNRGMQSSNCRSRVVQEELTEAINSRTVKRLYPFADYPSEETSRSLLISYR